MDQTLNSKIPASDPSHLLDATLPNFPAYRFARVVELGENRAIRRGTIHTQGDTSRSISWLSTPEDIAMLSSQALENLTWTDKNGQTFALIPDSSNQNRFFLISDRPIPIGDVVTEAVRSHLGW